MEQNPRNKKPKHPKKNNTKIPGNISWNMRPSNVQMTSKQKDATCEVRDYELPKLIGLIADIATGIWRMKNKFKTVKIDDMPDEIKKVCRHLESTLDALSNAKVEVRDQTDEKYVAGMALKVITFQPSSSVHIQMISETIRPSIFYNDKLIQMGEVIVKTPEKTESKESNNIKNVREHKERDTK